ncbi:hypothetical protein H4219_001772 [Mycoemilia scoparia]|uniref:Inhibitor of growth protein N-terminal histone-binding domain-containing protein n=1 Tax=Mycoemilia scoparia TaxID=417184 RepID=A0A9W8DPY8_9FUNG|nr:hypothetical protein H4219_001772 [Mycoemilia scoparia]
MDDIGLVLADFVATLGTLPPDIRGIIDEIQKLDEQAHKARSRARQSERALQKLLKEKTNREAATEEEAQLIARSKRGYAKAQEIADKKIKLFENAKGIVDNYLKTLEKEIKRFDKSDNLMSVIDNKPLNIGTTVGVYGNLTPILGTGSSSGGVRLFGNGGTPVPKRNSSGQFVLGNDLDEDEYESEEAMDSLFTPARDQKRKKRQRDGSGSIRGIRRYKKLGQSRNGPGPSGPGSLLFNDMGIDQGEGVEESDDQLYCFCQQVIFIMPAATPLKPIVGSFKRRIIRDVIIGIVGGTALAEVYWLGYGDRIKKTDAYFAKLEAERNNKN